MLIGVPKEIKNHEYRIGLTPAGVTELVHAGHEVVIETNGGAAIGFDDEQYEGAGARIAPDAQSVFAEAEMIVKVKEPQPDECRMLRPGQLLFTYLHLAPDPQQTKLLLESGASAIAYETVTSAQGGLPLLAPMSEVAGRMAIQAGCHSLEKAQGGSGTLLGGVPGVEPAKVMVIGGGVVGTNAARMAMGLGADVTIIDRSISRLKELDTLFGGRMKTLYSTFDAIERLALQADLVVGAVLIPGAAAPKLVSADLVRWWTSPSTRAAASRPRSPRRTRIRATSSTASCITAWRTCRAGWRVPRRSHLPTRRCPSCWRWRRRG